MCLMFLQQILKLTFTAHLKTINGIKTVIFKTIRF